MKTKTLALCVALLALAAVALAQETKPAAPPHYGIKSPDALNAFRAFETAERVARSDYFRATDEGRTKLVAALTASMDRATKAGNLDEAVRLRDAIADLKAGNAPAKGEANGGGKKEKGRTAEQLTKTLIGTKWEKSAPGERPFVVTLHEDMTATTSHHNFQGTWVAVNGNTVRFSVSMNGCGGQTMTVSPDGKQLLLPGGKADFKFKDK